MKISTISIIINDWKKIFDDKNLQDDIKIIDSQLQKCKNILSEILNYSGWLYLLLHCPLAKLQFYI